MDGSGSLKADDGDFPLQQSEAFKPEESMNLSKLLYDDDEDAPSLTESYDQDGSMDWQQLKNDRISGSGQMMASVAVAGGVQAMRAVYNRLRGGDDDADDDMPGFDELITQSKQLSAGTQEGATNASRWAQMHNGMSSSALQESTRGGNGFFMQSAAYVHIQRAITFVQTWSDCLSSFRTDTKKRLPAWHSRPVNMLLAQLQQHRRVWHRLHWLLLPCL